MLSFYRSFKLIWFVGNFQLKLWIFSSLEWLTFLPLSSHQSGMDIHCVVNIRISWQRQRKWHTLAIRTRHLVATLSFNSQSTELGSCSYVSWKFTDAAARDRPNFKCCLANVDSTDFTLGVEWTFKFLTKVSWGTMFACWKKYHYSLSGRPATLQFET